MPDPDQRPQPDYEDLFAPQFQNLRPEWIRAWNAEEKTAPLNPMKWVGAVTGGILIGLLVVTVMAATLDFDPLAHAATGLLLGLGSVAALIASPWWMAQAWLKAAALRHPEDATVASFLTVLLLGLMVTAGAVLRRLLQGEHP